MDINAYIAIKGTIEQMKTLPLTIMPLLDHAYQKLVTHL